jgi:hypothetical protein
VHGRPWRGEARQQVRIPCAIQDLGIAVHMGAHAARQHGSTCRKLSCNGCGSAYVICLDVAAAAHVSASRGVARLAQSQRSALVNSDGHPMVPELRALLCCHLQHHHCSGTGQPG